MAESFLKGLKTLWKKEKLLVTSTFSFYTLGKGEIAHHKRFLLSPQCFSKTFSADTRKPGLVWERVNVQVFQTPWCLNLNWGMRLFIILTYPFQFL